MLSWNRQDLPAFILACLWCAIYIVGGAISVQTADSAEFLVVAATSGIAHPSGYPLYTMLGTMATIISPFTAVRTLAILAALISAGTLLGIYANVKLLTRSRFAAAASLCFAGMSFHIWHHATFPEAFALLGFFASWLTYFALSSVLSERSEQQRKLSWYAYAFTVGLASCHHQTIVFTFPLGLYLLINLFVQNKTRLAKRFAPLALGITLFVVGLTPNAQLWIAGENPPPGSWGQISSVKDLKDHILRKEFGTFSSGPYEGKRPFAYHSLAYFERSSSIYGTFPGGSFSIWLIGFCLLLLHLFRKRPSLQQAHQQLYDKGWSIFAPTGALIGLLLSFVMTGMIFPSLLRMGTKQLEQYVVSRFFLLPDVFLAIFAGFAFSMLWQIFSQNQNQGISKRTNTSGKQKILIAMLVVFTIGTGFYQHPKASTVKKSWLENYLRDVLQELPKNALLLEAKDDVTCFGIPYLQEVLKIRRDVRFVCLPHLSRKWYVKQSHKRWPEFSYQWRFRKISSLALISHYRKLKRPVHSTTLYNRSMQMTFPWSPYGLTWQMTPKGQKQPSPQVVEKQLLGRFAKLTPPKTFPSQSEDPWAHLIMERYTYTLSALSDIYRRSRQIKKAKKVQKTLDRWTHVD